MEENDLIDIKKRKAHPYERANLLSKILFIWGFPLFYKGYKRELTEDDLYRPVPQLESKRLGDQYEKLWLKEEKKNGRNPSLWKVIFKAEYKSLGFIAFLYLINSLLIRIAQPLLIGLLLNYFDPKENTTLEDAYLYATLLTISNVIFVLVNHMFALLAVVEGQKIRTAASAMIYRKALRLSKTALGQTTVGQMVNLLSNDVRRFDTLILFGNVLWSAPVETIVIMYLLYINLGPTALVGTSILLIFIPIQYYIGKKTSSYRLQTALKTDQRVKMMNEIISGIQIIKIYTWEKPFAFLVEQIRKSEIQKIKGVSILRAISFSFSVFLSRASIFLCIITYVLTGNHLQPQYVFVATSFYTILRFALTMQVPMMITSVAEAHISVKRIQDFLRYDEVSPHLRGDDEVSLENGKRASTNGVALKAIKEDSKDVGIFIEKASAKWPLATENTLTNINFHATSGSLTAIVGTVGSGKTSLLHVILQELSITTGYLKVNGTLSYASQEPWLFSGSIRQNIVFGDPFDIAKYQEVIKVCSLSHDLEKFPYGDQSLVGEKGVTLSGGQKARINLARAIYRDADIYLLDDPLSAVDTHVGKQLFENCITGYLKDKCVILVTHQVQYLQEVGKIYFLENGEITVAGNYTDLQNSGKDFVKLFENRQQAEGDGERIELQQKALSLGKLNNIKPEGVKEHMETGKIAFSNFVQYFRAGGNCMVFLLIIVAFFLAQFTSSAADYFVTFWVNLEQDKFTEESNKNSTTTPTPSNETNSTTNIIHENVNGSIYEWFFTTENCIYIYTAIIISIIVLSLARSVSFYSFCMKASKTLHNNMFSKILNAPMYFFNTNNSGRILNRFSKDMGAIDEMLPSSFIDSLQIFLGVIASTFMITVVNPWIIIPTLVVFVLFYIYRNIYMATSRNLKRMEATTKSPVFTHLNASLQGLTTIRAMRAQKILKTEFDYHQDLNSSAYYMFTTSNRVFGVWLDFNCAIYTAIVIYSFLIMNMETYGGNVGLAITQSIALTGMLQWGMRQSSELENQITSVERVLEYTNITPESDHGEQTPPATWPQEGRIEFRNVYLKYSTQDQHVLKNLSFLIHPREKVGIVGRTGAGKSSLITALFRLAENEGRILIDSINTQKVSLNQLRSKVSVIPQEPILFSGPLRKNLDPFDEFSDSDLWFGLEQVELKYVIAELPAGLNTTISEGGSNFSVGQRQLICLARAVIRHNKILLLDEATANVDPHTDELIQKTIRTRFVDCTVLTVAHRLQTVMDSDKILVMSDGHAVEFDHPYNLLQNENGQLYELVQKTGKSMANQLTATAEKAFREQVKNK